MRVIPRGTPGPSRFTTTFSPSMGLHYGSRQIYARGDGRVDPGSRPSRCRLRCGVSRERPRSTCGRLTKPARGEEIQTCPESAKLPHIVPSGVGRARRGTRTGRSALPSADCGAGWRGRLRVRSADCGAARSLA